MATITLGGKTCQTVGNLPQIGTQAPDFQLVGADMSVVRLSDFQGEPLVLNIFPSIDTNVCATTVRRFNEDAAEMGELTVLTVSKDLPFALSRFRAGAGLTNVVMTTAYRSPEFGDDYGCTILDGGFATLLSRCVVVLDSEHRIVYTEQVPEISDEPDYDKALGTLT